MEVLMFKTSANGFSADPFGLPESVIYSHQEPFLQ
jgi:hypothetical protein